MAAPACRTAPMMTAAGTFRGSPSDPGIRRGLDLTIYPNLVINTEDTFATAAYLMGIPVMRQIDGKPVMEILDRSGEELLQPVK